MVLTEAVLIRTGKSIYILDNHTLLIETFKANEDPTFCRISGPVKNFAVIRWLKFLLSGFIDIDLRQKKKT